VKKRVDIRFLLEKKAMKVAVEAHRARVDCATMG